MNLAELVNLCSAVAPALQSRVPVLYRVTALPLEAGDKLPVVAEFDADGSLVVTVDTAEVYLVPDGPLAGMAAVLTTASAWEAIVKAFARYGDHAPDCPGLCATHPCTCGYVDAREVVRQGQRAHEALERIAHLDETEGAGVVGAAMDIARRALVP